MYHLALKLVMYLFFVYIIRWNCVQYPCHIIIYVPAFQAHQDMLRLDPDPRFHYDLVDS